MIALIERMFERATSGWAEFVRSAVIIFGLAGLGVAVHWSMRGQIAVIGSARVPVVTVAAVFVLGVAVFRVSSRRGRRNDTSTGVDGEGERARDSDDDTNAA